MFNIDLVELLPFFLNVHFLCGFMLGVFVGVVSAYKFLSKHYKEVIQQYKAMLEERDKIIALKDKEKEKLEENVKKQFFIMKVF